MNLNLEALRTGQMSFADIVRDIRHTNLYTLTDELFDELEAISTKRRMPPYFSCLVIARQPTRVSRDGP